MNPLLSFLKELDKKGDKVGEVFDGTAFLAARTGANVIPVGIAGTEDSLPSGAEISKTNKSMLCRR